MNRFQNCSGVMNVVNKHKELLNDRVMSAIQGMIGKSKFTEEESLNELGYGNCLLLTIVHALSAKDLVLCSVLFEEANDYAPLRSSHFTAWILEDYNIDQQLVIKALKQLELLNKSKILMVPENILKFITDLAVKFGVDSTTAEPDSNAASNNVS